jgi:protein SCO1
MKTKNLTKKIFKRKDILVSHFFIFLILFILLSSNFSFADDQPKKSLVGIDEKLGQLISLDISLIDETGKTVQLKNFIDNSKPIILSLVYYRCPGLCSPLLSGVADVVSKLDMEAGKDYCILTISFDPTENSIIAAEKKKNYLKTIKNKTITPDSWRFFTADSTNIARITDAVGFRYIKQGNDFVHSGVLTILSPQGKVVRYLYGTDFLQFDMKMALIEASEGKVGSTIANVLTLCYSYDPEGRKYALNITRLAGGGVLLFIIVFVIFLKVVKKKNLQKKSENINE